MPEEGDLQKINAYARHPLTADEVYTFRVILCDNDIDRDGERFTEKALQALAELFVGKTGIFDHDPKAGHQAARIYDTRVVFDSSRKNALGADYAYLLADAYMLRTAENAALIAEIDGGIKKEVSVGCSVKTRRCSICGSSRGDCAHRAGQDYGDKRCFFELDEPTDAYEWSFVAVPAQKNAGVVKAFGQEAEEILKSVGDAPSVLLSREQSDILQTYIHKLADLADLGKRYQAELARSVGTQMLLHFPEMPADMIDGLVKKLSAEELVRLSSLFQKKDGQVQLSADNQNFKI